MRREVSKGKWAVRWAALLLATVAPVGTAFGNAGPISTEPPRVGEPKIDLGAIAVVHEDLTIDLRRLVNGRAVHIDAVYRFHNSGPAVTIPAAFATPRQRSMTATIDGQPIDARAFDPLADMPPLPARWSLALSEELKFGNARWFDLALPPGDHELAVHVETGAGYNLRERPVIRRVDYLLSPARDWSAFGSLDIRLRTPEGYVVDVSPSLTAEEDGDLVGHFEGIPADVVSIQVRQDAGFFTRVWLLLIAVLGVGVLALLGRRSARAIAGASSAWTTLFVLGTPVLAVLWAIVWFAGYAYADEALLGPHAEYDGFTALLLALPISAVSGIVASISGLGARRRATPE